MRVLVIDDHPLIHEVIRPVVARALDPESIHCAGSLEDAFSAAEPAPPPDLVVLDLGLPGGTGLEALARARQRFPHASVVVFSAQQEPGLIRACFAEGASGYIPKTSSLHEIESALQLIARGGIYVPAEALPPGPPASVSRDSVRSGRDLSEREMQVLRHLVLGLSNKGIARKLDISENTVKQHVRSVFRVLHVSNRVEALVAAARQGIRLD